jgi:hypothetical protein
VHRSSPLAEPVESPSGWGVGMMADLISDNLKGSYIFTGLPTTISHADGRFEN